MEYNNIRKPFILYDHQIFDLQRFGGISRYFCEIMKKQNFAYDLSVRYSNNYYLNHWKLSKHLISLPRFIYKQCRKKCKKENLKLAIQLLQSKKEYIFHPTYYNPYFLEYIGDHPYVITVHDMIHEKFPQYFKDAAEVAQHKKEAIINAKRIIAISKNTKKDIIDLLHIDPDKIDTIYHGTSMKAFSGKYKLKVPERFLLFVGDRTPYKNFERFIETFARIHKEDNNLFAVYTGSHLNENEKRMIFTKGISEYVFHIKASDDALSELYSRALLFVYPSLYEGFGIPILEAYACHCPVALSNTSCFPEIAGNAAIYFDPYSIDSMFNAITDVIYNKEKRDQLILLGDARLNLYSWEKTAKETECTYLKAMELE